MDDVLVDRVLERVNKMIDEINSSGIDDKRFYLYKISTLFVIVEQQNDTILQLTNTLNKLLEDA